MSEGHVRLKQTRRFALLLLLLVIHVNFNALAFGASGPNGFLYQGRFFETDGITPMGGVVDLTLGIYDPTGTCLLYEESQTGINLTSTSGLFAVTVGSASATRTASDHGLSIITVFSNTSAAILPAT